MRTLTPLALIVFCLKFDLWAQSVSTGAPQAPTSFTDHISSDGTMGEIRRSPAAHLRETGGPASLQSLSLRGGSAKDVSVSLEGVPLNSVASGVFDFGLLNPYGLDDIKVIRGGYSPLSTSPSGQILLRLPQEPLRPRFTLAYGSYENLFLGTQLPFATFTMDRGSNDYRDHNAHSRFSFRTWNRTETRQIWTQVLYSQIQNPGPSNLNMLTDTETIRPTISAQWRWSQIEAQTFFTFQNQRVISLQTNRSFDGGVSLTHRKNISPTLSTELQIQQRFEKLLSKSFDSKLRATTSFGNSWLWSPAEGLILHPQMRGEYVSDLAQNLSVHPGVGLRWTALKKLQILTNASFIQRAPNFDEMYYDLPPFYIPNGDLKRETVWQGDLGYEWQADSTLQIQQALFADRKLDLIENTQLSPSLSQSQNKGSAWTSGLENKILWMPHRLFQLEGVYTFLMTRVDSDGSRQQLYQPKHKFIFIPEFFPHSGLILSLPLYYRASVLARTTGQRSRDQWDLGLDLRTGAIAQRLPLEFHLKMRNLLSRDREETLYYPLPDEPTFSLSASTVF